MSKDRGTPRSIRIPIAEFYDVVETVVAGSDECWAYPVVNPKASVVVETTDGLREGLRRFAHKHFTGQDMPIPPRIGRSNACGTRKCINPAHYAGERA